MGQQAKYRALQCKDTLEAAFGNSDSLRQTCPELNHRVKRDDDYKVDQSSLSPRTSIISNVLFITVTMRDWMTSTFRIWCLKIPLKLRTNRMITKFS